MSSDCGSCGLATAGSSGDAVADYDSHSLKGRRLRKSQASIYVSYFFVCVAWWQFIIEKVVYFELSIHLNSSYLDIHFYVCKYIFATFM